MLLVPACTSTWYDVTIQADYLMHMKIVTTRETWCVVKSANRSILIAGRTRNHLIEMKFA